ncbi:MAG: general secretion pathway protein GspB [Methylobacter sp.]|nr:general secretion pathway protein GspB [Candidatus Methylobacter titanis]
MSFILNALRKSEQERQALQPETVNDRILLPQPQQHRNKTAKFLVFLIVANVLAIGGFAWFIRNDLRSTPDKTPFISKSLPAQETPIASEFRAETPTPKSKPDASSIAELIDGQKPEPAPLPIKPVIAKKPAADTLKQAATASKAIPPIPTAVDIQPAPPEPIPVKNDLLFLNDLPFDFRQTIPKFAINVFVYSQQPEDRWVMIDMVKYKPGQQIKDALLLKEIRPDSLVVVYQNRTFQIKRP